MNPATVCCIYARLPKTTAGTTASPLGYAGMGWLASRTTAGITVKWRRDTEGRVVAVVDERGQEHRFERDGVGRVRIKHGTGEIVTRFERDAAGRVVVEHRPGKVIVKHVYDAAAGSLVNRSSAPLDFRSRYTRSPAPT